MKRTNISLIALVILAIFAIGLTGCSSKRTVVKVNDEKVTQAEFRDRLQKIPIQTPQGQTPAGRVVMQQIILEKLNMQLAKDQKVEPTDADVQKRIDRAKKDNPDFAKQLTAQGMTLDDLKKQLRPQLAMINVATKGITVPDADVKKAYDQALKATPSPFVRPEAVMVSGIIAKDKARIDKAYSLLQGGTDFTTVAMQYNDDPNLQKQQGKLNWLAKEDPRMPPALKNTAYSLAIGKYSKPFNLQGQWVILKVDSKRPKKVTPYDEVKDMIREQIALQEGAKKGTYQKAMQAYAKKAEIDIKLPAYKNIAELIKKQAAETTPQAQPATPAATPAPGK